MIEIQGRQAQQQVIRDIRRQFANFLQTFEIQGDFKYKRQAQSIANAGKHTFTISYSDFINFNQEVAFEIFNSYYKYEPHLNQTLTQWMHEFLKSINIQEEDNQKLEAYDVAFDDGLEGNPNDSVRELKSEHLGRLKAFRGTVTRTSEVRPQLLIGIFKCMTCGSFSKEVYQQFKYTQPKKCLKNSCDSPLWQLDLKRSKFADFQKIRVQQDPTRIPPGAMPRSIDVVLRNDNTEKGQPGDILKIVGYLCVSPDISSMLKPGERTQLSTKNQGTRGNMGDLEGVTGIKGIRELNYKLIFIATSIKVENNQFSEQTQNDEMQEDIVEMELEQQRQQKFTNEYFLKKIYSRLHEKEIEQINQMQQNPSLYNDLSQSLFPSIFGHSQIKKALLLQLFGGIHKKTETKINIRGDVNILIVGDPSTAKSQFLKCVNKFVPRSVYTNGKTTSAAGLTASVTKDENGNVSIEAGALMLADNGICCIDEFDKMDIKDVVAIHEAMEQQTISIAKAGVHATLNARTSILAAANPIFGRYDKSKALKYNINISPPIMSRFDLFFVICDEADNLHDFNLARFIVDLHSRKNVNQPVPTTYTHEMIKKYITIAKKIKPRLTHEAAQILRKTYIQLRVKDKMQSQNSSYRITVRQLESMIRLSQAYARLEMDPEVKAHHVREAERLIKCSIIKMEKSPIQLDTEQNLIESMSRMNFVQKNVIQQEMDRRQQEKKSKHVTISHEIYQQIQKNVSEFFKNFEKKSKEDDENMKISQAQLVGHLLEAQQLSGVLGSMEDIEHMRKVLNAVIKKLIKEERMLMVIEESSDLHLKMIGLHPNYEE